MSTFKQMHNAMDVSQAACKDSDPELFFPEKMTQQAAADAKAVCAECPIIADCLTWAVTAKELGIWGGTTENDRKRLHSSQALASYVLQLRAKN